MHSSEDTVLEIAMLRLICARLHQPFISRKTRLDGMYWTTRLEDNVSSQQPTHRMSNEDDICLGRFKRLEPCAEVIASNINSLIGLISRINLGVHHMTIKEG